MPILPLRRTRSGAASTETIIVTLAIGVALLLFVTLFGRKLVTLTLGASTSMDSGQTPVGAGSTATAVDGTDGSQTAGPLGGAGLPSAGASGMHGFVPGQPVFPPLDADFSDADKKRIELILSTLPPGLDLPISKVVRLPDGARNAWYNTQEDNLYLGRYVLHPDAPGGYNDHNRKMLGIDLGYTTERILYHEMMHAWGDNNEAAQADFVKRGNYQSKRNTLMNDSEYTDAVGNRDILNLQFDQEAKDAGMKVEDFLAAHPDKQKELLVANQAISAAMEKNGFPSRYPGDNHAATDSEEFFAILLEMNRYAPGKFDDYKKRGIVTPAQVEWIEAHSDLY